MTQPTPGPFELIIDDGRLIIVGSATHGDIAEFFDCEESTVKTTREEALANARLFMAAGAMADALRRMLENYGPPETVAFLFDYPTEHPITKAREALRQLEPPDDDRSMRVSGAAR